MQNAVQISTGKKIAVVLGAFLLMFASAIVSNSTTYFIVAVTEAIGVTRAAFSIYYTIVTFSIAIASLSMGSFIQKLGFGKTLLIGCICAPIGFFILSQLDSLWMVYVAAVFVGVGQAFITVPVVSIVNAWFPENNGAIIGLTMAATGFGGIMMSAVMPNLIASVSWRTGYIFCCIAFLILSVVAMILVGGKPPVFEDKKSDGSNTKEETKKSGDYQRVLRSPSFWGFFVCAFMVCGSNMITQHLSAHLEAQGMSTGMLSAIMGAWSLALAICKIVEGFLYDKVGAKIFVPFTMTVCALSYIILTLSNVPALIVGVLCVAYGGASITVLFPLINRDLYGTKLSTALWGFIWAGFQFGISLWTPVYGWLYDMTGAYNVGLYLAATITLLSMLFITVLMAQRRRERAAEQERAEATV